MCVRERGRGERKREHTCLFCESDAYVNLHFYVHIYMKKLVAYREERVVCVFSLSWNVSNRAVDKTGRY